MKKKTSDYKKLYRVCRKEILLLKNQLKKQKENDPLTKIKEFEKILNKIEERNGQNSIPNEIQILFERICLKYSKLFELISELEENLKFIKNVSRNNQN
jgi:hypothetical protein